MVQSDKTASEKAQGESQGSGAQPQEEKAGGKEKKAGVQQLGQLWYNQKHREIVVYLIAVFCLELIVGTIAFFYGVTHAEPVLAGGPKMARFPWIGWLVASILSPVGLLLLLHLSGQFFSGAFKNNDGGTSGGAGGGNDHVPERVQKVYSIVRHAPTIVVLLGLLCLGCAVLFVDSAMAIAVDIGSALKPYILWIVGGIIVFLLLSYLGRLWFIARHKRVEQEYAYRLKVLETTGVIIMNKGSLPMRYENGQLQLLAENKNGQLKALPEKDDGKKEDGKEEDGKEDGSPDVEDATIVSDK